MKDDARKKKDGQGKSEADLSQNTQNQREEEDVDLEILSALEHMDFGSVGGQDDEQQISPETIELRLDDEDMFFGDEDSEGESAFRFDETLSAGLEDELSEETPDIDVSASFDEESQMDENLEFDESITFDLGDPDEDFSVDEAEADERDFLSSEDKYGLETREFRFDIDEQAMFSAAGLTLDEQDASDLTDDAESEETGMSLDAGLDDTLPEASAFAGAGEAMELDEDIAAGLPEEFDLTEDDESDTQEDEFEGHAVIDVGADQVIDLGSEEDLDTFETMTTSPVDEGEAAQEEDSDMELTPMEELPESDDFAIDLREEDESAQDDFMASLANIGVEIGEEAEDERERLSVEVKEEDGDIQEDTDEEENLSQVMIDGGLDLTEEDDEGEEGVDMAALVAEAWNQPMPAEEGEAEASPGTEDACQEEVEQEGDDIAESLENPEEPEPPVDDRAFLGLSLRLEDERMQAFEGMMQEAHTLQTYLDALDARQSEVKESIYRKLHGEYVARKTVIFKDRECIALLADVESDLQDMIETRAEFIDTVAQLNEELEEIKVRHLVGEYDDATLAEKEHAQNAEIALWQEKTEKIGQYIDRYQNAVDAERALNPLRNELSDEGAQMPVDAPDHSEQREAEASLEEDVMPGMEDGLMAEGLEEEAEEFEFPGPEDEGGEKENLEQEEEEVLSFGAIASGQERLESAEFGSEDEEFHANEFGSESDEFGEDEFELDALEGIEEEADEEFAYDIEGLEGEGVGVEEETDIEEAMVACPKCGRQTSAEQKFCVHCGGKIQRQATSHAEAAMVSCKKCGRPTPAAEKFCVHCGGKAQ